jgi:hypothetical protein
MMVALPSNVNVSVASIGEKRYSSVVVFVLSSTFYGFVVRWVMVSLNLLKRQVKEL